MAELKVSYSADCSVPMMVGQMIASKVDTTAAQRVLLKVCKKALSSVLRMEKSLETM